MSFFFRFLYCSLLRSGRCISMPSIVTSQVVTVAISPPATPPPVFRKVVKKGNKTKTSGREEAKSPTTKGSRSSVVAPTSPANDSGIYHLEESRTPGEKTTFTFSSEANTPSSGIDVAATGKRDASPLIVFGFHAGTQFLTG